MTPKTVEEELGRLLVLHGLVDAAAVEDPEWYDRERTLCAISNVAADLAEIFEPKD